MELTFRFLKFVLTIAGLVFLSACSEQTHMPMQARGAVVEVDKTTENIVGGKEVVSSTLVNNLFVMIVSDNNGTPQVCTGTFISTHHILTAAHCVNNTIDDISLVTGVKPLGEEQALVLTPVRVDRHANYNESSAAERNDLAIITVAESIGLKADEIPALPSAELARFMKGSDQIKFLAVGYGKTGASSDSTSNRTEGILRSVNLKANYKSSTILKVDQTSGQGVCYGDSGGPALKIFRKKHYIIGIASGIYNKGASQSIDECQGGSLYMNVVPYISWINSIINDSNF